MKSDKVAEPGVGDGRSVMADHNELEAALVGFTRMLLHGVSQTEVLHQLCQHAKRALHIDDVGISLAGPDGVLYVGETASDLARAVDTHQAHLQEGPCREAFDSGQVVVAAGEDLIEKWPRFGPFARDQGVCGAAALPLQVSGQRIGVLDCYWNEPGQRFNADDLTVAQAIADAATVYVLHARRSAETAGIYTAELEAANVSLHRSREIAVTANRAKDDLLSRTSHELRTPLNAILGFAQVIEMSPAVDADIAEAVDYILHAGRHLVNLIDDVLDVARIEAGDLDFDTQTIPTAELVDEAIRLVGPLAAVRNIAITLTADDGLPALHADRRRTLQVLLNLLSNATKYNHDGGTIDVSCAAATGRMRISVADTGPGLSAEQMTKLFIPFERLGAQNTDTEGTGIGLVLTKALTENMNGHIDLTSTPGTGTTVTIELPTSP